jgi:hypothetical protein
VRYAVEAILRLVPGIGDAAVLVNVAIEGAIGAAPWVGDAFDVAFRANRHNVRLLRGISMVTHEDARRSRSGASAESRPQILNELRVRAKTVRSPAPGTTSLLHAFSFCAQWHK